MYTRNFSEQSYHLGELERYPQKEKHFSVFEKSSQELLRQSIDLGKAGRLLYILARVAEALRAVKGGRSYIDQELIALLCGEHARALGDKSAFTHLVREIGYNSPDSLLVRQSDPGESRLKAVRDYYMGRGIYSLFCKPLHGTWQRDLKSFDINDQSLEKYLSEIQEDIVVQEYVPHQKVLRYVRYKDKQGRVFVACFEFKEDESGGKGRFHVPVVGKSKAWTKDFGVTLDEFIDVGRNLYAAPFSNENKQHDNMDVFMDNFAAKLEEKVGGPIPLLSVDIGLKQADVLKGDYSDKKIKDSVVFFETQSLSYPWRVKKDTLFESLKGNSRFWHLLFTEHGSEIVKRVKKLL